MPTHKKIDIESANLLNKDSHLLRQFLASKTHKRVQSPLSRPKLSQSDKDILIDLAQMVEVEPYDYLQVAHQAYLLTLEPYFVDINIYIKKLIENIAAMAFETDGSCAMTKQEILQRLEQFHHQAEPIFSDIPI
ncbi:hypothetical protein [Acinetobacter sp. NCu2D-2]|uniref:hypothetical protein n=1 Tax=Acinetobacter sp. NCu2D-2 TaxID=1608473 RepID=UPI000A73B16C